MQSSELFDCISRVLAPESLSESGTGATLAGEKPLAGKRLLLAEDNDVLQLVVSEMVEELGGETDLVGNGREVADRAASGGYDLVLMDCQMPIMDGYEATRVIRKREEFDAKKTGGPLVRVPIVAMTAHVMAGERERCLASGMDDYLTKPLREAELLRVAGVEPDRSPGPVRIARNQPAAARPHHPTDSSIDRGALDVIRSLEARGSKDLTRKAIAVYLESSTRLITRMREAVEENAVEPARRAAHKLSGSSTTLGATQLAFLCQRLQRLEDKEFRGVAAEIVSAVETEFENLKTLYSEEFLRKAG